MSGEQQKRHDRRSWYLKIYRRILPKGKYAILICPDTAIEDCIWYKSQVTEAAHQGYLEEGTIFLSLSRFVAIQVEGDQGEPQFLVPIDSSQMSDLARVRFERYKRIAEGGGA